MILRPVGNRILGLPDAQQEGRIGVLQRPLRRLRAGDSEDLKKGARGNFMRTLQPK